MKKDKPMTDKEHQRLADDFGKFFNKLKKDREIHKKNRVVLENFFNNIN